MSPFVVVPQKCYCHLAAHVLLTNCAHLRQVSVNPLLDHDVLLWLVQPLLVEDAFLKSQRSVFYFFNLYQ